MFRAYYISQELKKFSFTGILFFFVISMWLIILFSQAPTLILGWDLLGISSFLLVVFYPSKIANHSGIITLLYNRLGDVFLVFLVIIYLGGYLNVLNISIYCLLVCLITKRAQFPFSLWLPAAIMAPTPISALVHSSTLVTAGVYVLVRYRDLLEFHPTLLLIVRLRAIITRIGGGIMGLISQDGKKVVAYSTLSQLGFIVLAGVFRNLCLCRFHLFTHAIFKSLLFVYFGVGIHQKFNSQEIRKEGSPLFSHLIKKGLDVCILRIIGFSFLSGFFSKDLIFEGRSSHRIKLTLGLLIYFTLSVTRRYCFRLFQVTRSLKKSFTFSNSGEKNLFLILATRILLSSVLWGGLILSRKYFLCIPLFQKLSIF